MKVKSPTEPLQTVNNRVTTDGNPGATVEDVMKHKDKTSGSCNVTSDLDSSLTDFDISDAQGKRKVSWNKKKERVKDVNGERNAEPEQSMTAPIEVSYEDFLKQQCLENGSNNDSETERSEENTGVTRNLENNRDNIVNGDLKEVSYTDFIKSCDDRESADIAQERVLSFDAKNDIKDVEVISDNTETQKGASPPIHNRDCNTGDVSQKSGKPSSRKSSDISSFFKKPERPSALEKKEHDLEKREQDSIICVEADIHAEPTPKKKLSGKVFSIFSKKSAKTGLEAGAVEMLPAFEGKKTNVAVADDTTITPDEASVVEIPDSTLKKKSGPNKKQATLKRSLDKKECGLQQGKLKSDAAVNDPVTCKTDDPDIIVEGESKSENLSISNKTIMADKMASLDQIKVRPIGKTSQATLSFGKGGLTTVKQVKPPVPDVTDSKKAIDMTSPVKSNKKKRKSNKVLIESDNEETIDITSPETTSEKKRKKKKMVIQSDDDETIKTPKSRSKRKDVKDRNKQSLVKLGNRTKKLDKEDKENNKK